jgi:hypothetical protein
MTSEQQNKYSFASDNFTANEQGVYYLSIDKQGNNQKLWLSSPLYVEAYFCDAHDYNHGYLLTWPSAKTKEWHMPAELLAGDGYEIIKRLLAEDVESHT